MLLTSTKLFLELKDKLKKQINVYDTVELKKASLDCYKSVHNHLKMLKRSAKMADKQVE